MRDIQTHADDLAARFESDEFEFVEDKDGTPLREVAKAVLARAKSEQRLVDAVHAARSAGLSWSAISMYLGTTAEAARQRYSPEPG